MEKEKIDINEHIIQLKYVAEPEIEKVIEPILHSQTIDEQIEQIEQFDIEVDKIEDPIYTKYITNITEPVNIDGLEYGNIMEILRYCERVMKTQVGLNTTCKPCWIDLIKIFINIR